MGSPFHFLFPTVFFLKVEPLKSEFLYTFNHFLGHFFIWGGGVRRGNTLDFFNCENNRFHNPPENTVWLTQTSDCESRSQQKIDLWIALNQYLNSKST